MAKSNRPSRRPGTPGSSPGKSPGKSSGKSSGNSARSSSRKSAGKPGGKASGSPRKKAARRTPRRAPESAGSDSGPDGIRLQKVLAEAGLASRRDCEQLIEAGRVRVNGQVRKSLPVFVNPATDRIEVDGDVVKPHKPRGGVRGGHTYVILNKPRHVITTTDDEQGRPTVLDLVELPEKIAKRLYPVGRLDAESTGLILLTNDGELANRLTHPRYETPKVYRVSILGVLSDADVAKLQQGMMLAHKPQGDRGPTVKRASISTVRKLGVLKDRQRGDRTKLEVTLNEGQNREIRRLFAKLGHKVNRLERTAIGPIRLKGLARRQWRLLTVQEIGQLRRSVGL